MLERDRSSGSLKPMLTELFYSQINFVQYEMRAIDKSRLTNKYGALKPATLNALAEAVLSAMGIDLQYK